MRTYAFQFMSVEPFSTSIRFQLVGEGQIFVIFCHNFCGNSVKVWTEDRARFVKCGPFFPKQNTFSNVVHLAGMKTKDCA